MKVTFHTEMLELATRLSEVAGAMAIAARATTRAKMKHDQSVVTETDLAIQAYVVAAIKEHFPGHAIIGEETPEGDCISLGAPSERYCWVIDPIDGTRNYVASFPCFGTSIAVLDRGTPVVAAVREHNTGRLVTAVAGGGTTLDGEPVSPSDSMALTEAIVAVPSSKEPLTVAVVQLLAATNGVVLRDMGATTIHLAMVGSGALAGAFGERAKLWDVAGGSLLVKEAGGVITGAFGEPFFPISLKGDHDRNVPFLAGTPEVHARLLGLVRSLAP